MTDIPIDKKIEQSRELNYELVLKYVDRIEDLNSLDEEHNLGVRFVQFGLILSELVNLHPDFEIKIPAVIAEQIKAGKLTPSDRRVVARIFSLTWIALSYDSDSPSSDLFEVHGNDLEVLFGKILPDQAYNAILSDCVIYLEELADSEDTSRSTEKAKTLRENAGVIENLVEGIEL